MAFTHQDGAFHDAAHGAQLYYEQKGNPQGFPLLFLHGGTCDMSSFNAMVEVLGEHYRCIGLDTRGHGRSTLGSVPLSYALLQQDVESLLTALGVESCHVIGHSDGGIVALRMAAARACLLNRIVVIGTHWTIAEDTAVAELYADVSPEFWRQHLSQLVDQYERLNREPDFDRLLSHLSAMWLDDSGDGYPGNRVQGINEEVLVVRGDDDPLVSLAHTAALVDQLKEGHFLNVPFCGHSVHEEASELVTRAVSEFLA